MKRRIELRKLKTYEYVILNAVKDLTRNEILRFTQNDKPNMLQLLLRILLSALGVMLVAYLVPGIAVASFWIALVAAIVLGVVNALVRPLLHLIALPITILTLGLFSLVINAATFALAAWLVPGFTVSGFGPALWGAIAFAVYSWLVNTVITEEKKS